MFLARIDGEVTALQRHASIKGFPLLIGQRLDADLRSQGEPQILIDPIGAGRGSVVLVSSDGEQARKLLKDNRTPSRMVILGIVDEVVRTA